MKAYLRNLKQGRRRKMYDMMEAEMKLLWNNLKDCKKEGLQSP